MDNSVQTLINSIVDNNLSLILDRFATKMQEASELQVVDYDALRHQAVLMQYTWEGVHQLQAVRPDTYLADALALMTQAVNRANAATQQAESINTQISSAEEQRVLAETARANAEDLRAAAEQLRVAAEQNRVSAENTRGTNEQTRQTQEQARVSAELSRSGQFNVLMNLIEDWYSNDDPADPGIKERVEGMETDFSNWEESAQNGFNAWFGQTENSEGSIRKAAKTWLTGAQSDYQALNTTMTNNEQTRQTQEQTRQTNETARGTAETARETAEGTRSSNEQTRQANEQTRQTNEGGRTSAENLRETAEGDREDAETLRASAETQRQTAYSTLMTNIAALYQQMLSRANHPAQFGQDGYIYEWDLTTEQYVRTNHFWQKFDRFRISKEFASIALMRAYDPDNLPEGESPLETFAFVLIKSTPADPDNSKLFSYMGEDAEPDPDYGQFHYLGDFSGAMGFEGKTPQFSIGTVVAGDPGTQPQVTISANGTDANGNPCFLLNFAIPRGADGRGIASMQQIQQSNTSEGENIWRATFTDGATADFIVLNGAAGANAGIGEASASVDSGVGTPSVTVNTGGNNSNRIFSFAFHNLKGATFTPSVDANGNLSWTNNGGLQNPATFNILSAIPVATQLQNGLMAAADKQKLDLSLPLATSTVSDLTAADADGKTAFWGSQDPDTGKWTLQKMTPLELQKLAYNYIKQTSQINELSQLLSDELFIKTVNIQPQGSYTFNRGYGLIVASEHYSGYSGLFIVSAFDNVWLYNGGVDCLISHSHEYVTTVTAKRGTIVCTFIGF